MNLQQLGMLAAEAKGLIGPLCLAWDGEGETDPGQVEISKLVRRFSELFVSMSLESLRILQHLDSCRLCSAHNLVGVIHENVENRDELATIELQRELEARVSYLVCVGAITRADGHLVRLSHLGKGIVRVLREQQCLPVPHKSRRPRAFIGSSTEGLPIAYALQRLLARGLGSVVWEQGGPFKLGAVNIEALEQAVYDYEYGIFIFTPDDKLEKRERSSYVARDNVLFELGLFMGKLSRRRVFLVKPKTQRIELPTDILGMVTATYDDSELTKDRRVVDDATLSTALGATAQEILQAAERCQSELKYGECVDKWRNSA